MSGHNSSVAVPHRPKQKTISTMYQILYATKTPERPTRSAPVTSIKIPPAVFEGCASRVETACLTFSKGRPYVNHSLAL
jgi:hypothetical protein